MNFNWIKLGLTAGILFFCIFGKMAYASEKEGTHVTEQEFITKLQNIVKEQVMEKVMEKESVGKKYITRERAAYFIVRAEEAVEGEKFNKALYDAVLEKNRISDFSKVKKNYRDSVVKAYIKGIMPGTGNGDYSKSRAFRPRDYLSKKEGGELFQRFKNKAKRKTLSSDGQLVRTTGLPNNYKDFPYILASYPNSYYESMFDYERIIGKAVEGKDYVKPKDMEKQKITKIPGENISMKWLIDTYGEQWANTVKENLAARFNINWRTIDRDKKWLNKLRSTYYFYDDKEYDKIETKKIKAYIENVKKNKVEVKGIVHVDKSSLYISTGKLYLRAHVRFKLLSPDSIPKDLTQLFYGERVFMRNLQKGTWIDKYYDISVGSPNGYSLGADFAITDNNLLEPLVK